MIKIAIVNSSSFGKVFPEHLLALQEFAETEIIKVAKEISPQEFTEVLKDYDGILASTNPDYPAEMLENLPKLKIIARHGIGFNNIDIDAAQKLGIIVTKVLGPVERNSVAEHNLALLMSAARWTPHGDKAVRNSDWKSRASFVGKEVTGKTIGIIGLGNIGSRSAEILAKGFNAKVLVNDANKTAEEINAAGYQAASLEELLKQSDFICLHCAHTPASHHLLGKEQFQQMKAEVIIVNTARGELVDDQAMLEFLNNGKIRVYATDVIEGEPIDGDHHLLQANNVIVVPHLGGYSEESLHGMGQTMVDNLHSVFVDKKMPVANLVPGLELNEIRK